MSRGTRDSSVSSNVENLEALRERITLSNSDLHELAKEAEQFGKRIAALNEQGIEKLEVHRVEQALAYFSEAERCLEYAASCGRTINRVLITTTLRNKACAHQKLWDLSPSSDYMEALLHNLQSYIDCEPVIEISSELKNKNSLQFQDLTKLINRRILIGLCELQNSALISQTGDHAQAKKSAENSLEHFQRNCEILCEYERVVKSKNSELLEELNTHCVLERNTNKIDKIMKKTKIYLLKMKRHRLLLDFETERIVQLSIGDIMRIGCMTVDEALKSVDPDYYISHEGIIYLAMYVACAHFVIAAETRLISQQKYGDVPKKSVSEFLESELYHLQSISIMASVVMLESNLLAHLMKSFKNHYGIDLEYEDAYFDAGSSIDAVSQGANTHNEGEHRDQGTTAESEEVCVLNQEERVTVIAAQQRGKIDPSHLMLCVKDALCCEHTVENTPSSARKAIEAKKPRKHSSGLRNLTVHGKEGLTSRPLLTFGATGKAIEERRTSRSKDSCSKNKKCRKLIKVKSNVNLGREAAGEYYKKEKPAKEKKKECGSPRVPNSILKVGKASPSKNRSRGKEQPLRVKPAKGR